MSNQAEEDTRIVMESCQVDKLQATKLLEHSGNDPDKARYRYQTLMRFMNGSLDLTGKPHTHQETPNVHENSKKVISSNVTHSIKSSGQKSNDTAIDAKSSTFEDVQPQSPIVSSGNSRCARQALQHDEGGNLQLIPFSSSNLRRGSSTDSRDQQSCCSFEDKNDSDSMDMTMDFSVATNPAELWLNRSFTTSITERSEDIPGGTPIAVSKDNSQWGTESPTTEQGPQEQPVWNFLLPELPASVLSVIDEEGNRKDFDVAAVAAALQHGVSEHAIETYFQYYDPETIHAIINDTVAGFPSIFYAVATNNDRLLRLWAGYGGDINAVHAQTLAPLLAFAIMHSGTIKQDTSGIVATLLSLGASPLVIPSLFYTPYLRNVAEINPEQWLGSMKNEPRVWLTKDTNLRLMEAMHLTHRYNLYRAAQTPKSSVRHWHIARRWNAEALLGLPFFLIGQSTAANLLLKKLLSNLAVLSHKPLVLVFAGPSGHGKTELARRLGYLMNLELEVVDCTIVNREMELFGGRHLYVNAEQGTPLNNFLARHHGQRCIVFLDEFEKTTKEIHQALLLPFDNGEYQDRRTLQKVDCSKTIWILATNALDARIKSFCLMHEEALYHNQDEITRTRLLKTLSKDLRQDFLAEFKAPLTGRVSDILPFFLFSPDEQAVIAHKYLLELGREVRNPVCLMAGPAERLVGNVRLHIRKDALVCRTIAAEGYHSDLGARSLISAVDQVKALLIDLYLNIAEPIKESSDFVDCVVDETNGEIVANIYAPTRR